MTLLQNLHSKYTYLDYDWAKLGLQPRMSRRTQSTAGDRGRTIVWTFKNNQKRAVENCADDKLQNQRELGYKLSISSLNELEILFLSIESIVTESVQTLLVNSFLFIYRCLCSLNFSITIFALAFTGLCKLRQRCHKSTLFLLVLFFLGAFVWCMIRRCAAQEHTLLREKRDKSLSISCCETVMYHFMQRATNLSPDWFGDGFSEYCTSLWITAIRGDEILSIKIFNYSQNFTFARFARKI